MEKTNKQKHIIQGIIETDYDSTCVFFLLLHISFRILSN